MTSTSIYFTEYAFSSPTQNIRVSTSSVEEVPSNKVPLLNLTCNGFLLPSSEPYILVLTFPESKDPSKDSLSGLYGTFCIGKKVLNATRIMRSVYNKEERKLTIDIDLRGVCTMLERGKLFSFAIQLKDCSNNAINCKCGAKATPETACSCRKPCQCYQSSQGNYFCQSN